MSFGERIENNTNNMLTKKTEKPLAKEEVAGENVGENVGEINTAELAQKTLQEQRGVDTLEGSKTADVAAYNKTLESIPGAKPKTEASSEQKEAARRKEIAERLQKRKEFADQAYQMLMDNVQGKVEQKGISGWLNPTKEMKNSLDSLKILKDFNKESANSTGTINLDTMYGAGGAAVFASKKVRREIEAMANEQFDAEDLKILFGSEQQRNQSSHEMSNVSAG